MKVNFKALLALHFDFKVFYFKIKNKNFWTAVRTSAIIKILPMVFSQMALERGDFRFLKCISKSYAKKSHDFAFWGKKKSTIGCVSN